MSGEREGVDVGALRALAEAATPGRWHSLGGWVAYESGGCTCGAGAGSLPHEGGCGLEEFVTTTRPDAAFIAAANPAAITALLDRLAAAEGALARVWALADEWSTFPCGGSEPLRQLRAALDGAPVTGEGE